MVLLQNYYYIQYFMYNDITSSPFLFNFDKFVAFFVAALVERATRKM